MAWIVTEITAETSRIIVSQLWKTGGQTQKLGSLGLLLPWPPLTWIIGHDFWQDWWGTAERPPLYWAAPQSGDPMPRQWWHSTVSYCRLTVQVATLASRACESTFYLSSQQALSAYPGDWCNDCLWASHKNTTQQQLLIHVVVCMWRKSSLEVRP